MKSVLPITFFALCTSLARAAVPNAPSNATFRWPFRTFYCPYAVSGELADDFSSITLTYDTSKPGPKSSSQDDKTCFSRFYFDYNYWDNQLAITEIEYSGADTFNNAINTKTVLKGNYGPMYWNPVTITPSTSALATNASRTQIGKRGIGDVAIRTMFSGKVEGKLTQKLKLAWSGPGKDDGPYSCEWPDNMGNVDTLKLHCRYVPT